MENHFSASSAAKTALHAAAFAPQTQTGCVLVERNPLEINGRRGGIRTRDPLHPMQVRYQAALHADKP